MPERAQVFFHRYADDFDAIYSNRGGPVNSLINRMFRKSMRLRYLKTLEGCNPIEGKTVLDVGCGPGHYSITLAQRGAAHVLGIDFAEGMLSVAAEHARAAGVADRCEFRREDFGRFTSAEPFDYLILMGLMDYMREPDKVIEKALSLTRSKAFFSFPMDGGVLAWQRKLRYRNRCDLFLYTYEQLQNLFYPISGTATTIEPISRDFFVVVSMTAGAALGSRDPARTFTTP